METDENEALTPEQIDCEIKETNLSDLSSTKMKPKFISDSPQQQQQQQQQQIRNKNVQMNRASRLRLLQKNIGTKSSIY